MSPKLGKLILELSSSVSEMYGRVDMGGFFMHRQSKCILGVY